MYIFVSSFSRRYFYVYTKIYYLYEHFCFQYGGNIEFLWAARCQEEGTAVWRGDPCTARLRATGLKLMNNSFKSLEKVNPLAKNIFTDLHYEM